VNRASKLSLPGPSVNLRAAGFHPDANSKTRLLHPEGMRRFHRCGNKFPQSLMAGTEIRIATIFHSGMCAFSCCDYRPISSMRGGLLLASAWEEIKGYINAARPFISSPSAAHCPLPLSDEVERCNNTMRRKAECTH
jgi:hypothetical protein